MCQYCRFISFIYFCITDPPYVFFFCCGQNYTWEVNQNPRKAWRCKFDNMGIFLPLIHSPFYFTGNKSFFPVASGTHQSLVSDYFVSPSSISLPTKFSRATFGSTLQLHFLLLTYLVISSFWSWICFKYKTFFSLSLWRLKFFLNSRLYNEIPGFFPVCQIYSFFQVFPVQRPPCWWFI